MLLSFRPLISVSVLSLLGWCWYSFRRKRTRSPLLTKEEVYFHDGSNPVPCSPTDSCILEESNLKVDHGISTSSEMSKSMKALSVLLNSEPVLDILNLTSTSPVIGLTEGVRPEPEGQVSFRFPENLKTQKEIDNITVLEHLDASENDSGLESDPICASSSCLSTDSHPLVGLEPHPSRIEGPDVSSLSDLFPNEDLNLDDMEEISSRLVRQVINAAAEEWNQENLEPRDLCEPAGVSRPLEDGLKSTAQDLFPQQSISEASSELPSPLSYRPLSTSTWSDPVNDPSWLGNNSSSESHQDAGSFSDKILGHVGVSVGDDSGCSFCYLEDKSGVEETTSEITQEGQSFLITPAGPDTSGTESEEVPSILGVAEAKDEACREISSPDSGVKSLNRVNADTQLSCTSLAPPPAPPIIQWDIEVPAHLVGRLIGKQGKFVNHLKQSSGAKIYVSTLPFTQDIQICHIQGSQQQVDEALSLIRKKFKDLDLSNCVPMPCLPITSWLLLPQDVFVEVIVSQVEAGHHLFVLQHKHPSYQALPTLIQHMQLCYSQPGCPSLPTPVEVGVVCAAPVTGSGWQRAQVIQYHSETDTAHIRYVDDGGYAHVNSATLRQIRSDFVSLPFQAAEVLLDNITPLPGEEEFSLEAKAALEELTANVALILQVTGCQDGLPLVHLWKQTGDEVVLVNRLLVDRGVCSWIETQ